MGAAHPLSVPSFKELNCKFSLNLDPLPCLGMDKANETLKKNRAIFVHRDRGQ